MITRRYLNIIFSLLVVGSMVLSGPGLALAKSGPPPQANGQGQGMGNGKAMGQMRSTTQAQRMSARSHQNKQEKGTSLHLAGLDPATASMSPLTNVDDLKNSKRASSLFTRPVASALDLFNAVLSSILNSVNAASASLATMAAPNSPPDYFGIGNFANSPMPQLDLTGALIPGTGMRKFVDTLPGLSFANPTTANANNLGQYLPVAYPDTSTFPGNSAANPPEPASDYYEIALVQYCEQLHSDLPTKGSVLRGYVQIETPANAGVSKHVPLTNADVNCGTFTPALLNGVQAFGVDKPSYLGPVILTTRNRPVRVKFDNLLPTGPAGNLFIPTDTTYMGAGMGPGGSVYSVQILNGGSGYTNASVSFSGTGTGAAGTVSLLNGAVVGVTITNGGSNYSTSPSVTINGDGSGASAVATLAGPMNGTMPAMYTQNRATLHLHGGNTPWISDGTPHQWTTPAGEVNTYFKGDSAAYVPDMWFQNGVLDTNCAGKTTCADPGANNDPGVGSLTFYWTNQQSGRLMFYHDHAYGITRLNVYAGEAAGYLISDPAEEQMLVNATVPGTIVTDPSTGGLVTADLAHLVPLVIQDKTFVPDSGVTGGQLAATDPTWDVANYGGLGNLWFPHVYSPNQNPADISGANGFGHWDYGAWFWPAQDPKTYVPGGQPYPCTSAAYSASNPPAFPPLMCPGFPNPSGVMEGFMDTPLINGTAYPTLTVDPTAYRFQILNAANDRTLNLGLYKAEPLSLAVTAGGSGYTSAPTISFSGGSGGGTGAAATAVMSDASVTGYIMTNAGAGYNNAIPNVTITGNGTGATATAALDTTGNSVASLTITNIGSGYSYANITIDAPTTCGTLGTATCSQATANAVVTPSGVVLGLVVTNPGSAPWTAAPTVTFTGSGGSGAAAIASVNSEVKMVPANPPTNTSALRACSTAIPTSGAMLSLGLLDTSGNPLNGTGMPANCWPSSWPTDGRDGGVPDPTTAGPPIIQIGAEGGSLPKAVVIPSTPVNYEYNRRSITVLNVFNHGLMMGPAERADIVIDFSKYAGQTLIFYNDGPSPNPAFDPRTDYYTGDPDNTPTGGAPSTLPGYGPNTRTILQIKVNAVSATPDNFSLPTLTNALPGIFAATQDPIIVPEPDYPALNGGAATTTYVPIQATSISAGWTGGAVGGVSLTSGGTGYTSAPTVVFTGGGGSGASAQVTLGGTAVASLTPGNPGAGYTSAPAVTISGGGGTGATATAVLQGTSLAGLTLNNPGSGYTSAPTVNIAAPSCTINTTTCIQATASATLKPTSIGSLTLTSGGSGYTSAPTVVFTNATGDTGTGASATAILAPTGVGSVSPVIAGMGYTSAPAVNLTGGGGSGASATAVLAATGSVVNLGLTSTGSGYTSAPAVSFTGGAGSGAAATANWGMPVASLSIVKAGKGYLTPPQITIAPPQAPGGTTATAVCTINKNGVITSITLTNPGSGYTTAPAVTIAAPPKGGAQATATAKLANTGWVVSLSLVSGGSGYSSAPSLVFTGGGGTGASGTATVGFGIASFTVTSGTGYTTAPSVSIAAPTGCTPAPFGASLCVQATASALLAPTSIASLTLNSGGTGYAIAPSIGFSGGGGSGAAASATLSPTALAGLSLTNPGAGYTSTPVVTFTGGGCGTNCAPAAATANLTPTGVASYIVNTGGIGYTSAPLVSVAAPLGCTVNCTQATATAVLGGGSIATITLLNGGIGYTSAPVISFDTGGGPGSGAAAIALPSQSPMQPKAIQELFTTDYGRMNATLGVELPFTNFNTQTTIPYGYVDPPTEILRDGQTQFWKITHNGVDTHFIHFHLFTVQVVNRVGWDGMIKPPDINELGWKDTVRMNPLEDVIVAIKPLQQNLPFQLPNSVRPLDVTMPIGATPGMFAAIDPNNQPATVANDLVNFGDEYVWHCHILDHEEIDMMRPMAFAVAPVAPTALTLLASAGVVSGSFVDNSINETGFTVQRGTSSTGPWTTVASLAAAPGTGTTVGFTDASGTPGTTYYYQVIANNLVGYTGGVPANSYPSTSADSTPVVSGPVVP